MSQKTSLKSLEEMDVAFPATLAEALARMADEHTRGRLLSGGTDLMVQWSSGVASPPERVISLSGLKELQGIAEEGERLVLGALVTHAQLRASPLVQQFLPALAASAATVGGAQIQARGTLAGNVANASPAGDLAPALLVAKGAVVVASASGEREIPLDQFYKGYRKIDLRPEEIIVRFLLKKKPAESVEGFRKLGPRAAQAISKVMGAYRLQVREGVIRCFHVALGSVAATPIRLTAVEDWIKGRPVNPVLLDDVERRVSESITPISDIRSTAEYRKWVAGRLVRGFLEDVLPPSHLPKPA